MSPIPEQLNPMDVPEIEIQQAQLLLKAGTATFVDVRDPDSFSAEHIPGATHLDDSNVQQFIASADKQATVVVYCYHGNSSLGATAFFQDQGFTAVSSLSGGFTAWHEAGGASEQGPPDPLRPPDGSAAPP